MVLSEQSPDYVTSRGLTHLTISVGIFVPSFIISSLVWIGSKPTSNIYSVSSISHESILVILNNLTKQISFFPINIAESEKIC